MPKIYSEADVRQSQVSCKVCGDRTLRQSGLCADCAEDSYSNGQDNQDDYPEEDYYEE